MAKSFIIQSVDVLCTYQTSPNPQRIGYFKEDRKKPLAVHRGKKEAILKVTDTKIENPFPCKMPGMIWGGLAMLVAGLVVAAVVVAVVVATGGAALAVVAAAAIAAAKVMLIAGAVVIALSVGIGVYEELHYCDNTQCSKWILGHNTVKIEGEYALLNRSILTCPVGGRLTLVLNPTLAKQAAKMIAELNNEQLWIQSGNKFLQGIVGQFFSEAAGGFAPGPMNIIGFLVNVTCELIFDVGGHYSDVEENRRLLSENPEAKIDDPYKKNLVDDAITDATKEEIAQGVGLIQEAAPAIVKDADIADDIARINNEMARAILRGDTDAIDDAVRAGAKAALERDEMWRDVGKNLGKGLVAGIIAGVINYGIDQFAKSEIRKRVDDISNISKDIADKNNNPENFINIVAQNV